MVNIKKRNKLISIIIPCHNCSKYIRRTIDSIISQEWQSKNGTMGKICDDNNIEIIMIDDCSDDNCQTKNELKRISKDYSIVKCIYLDENKGQAEARNIGLRLARGQYLGFVDADDTINPGLFLEIQKQLNKNNNYTFDILI